MSEKTGWCRFADAARLPECWRVFGGVRKRVGGVSPKPGGTCLRGCIAWGGAPLVAQRQKRRNAFGTGDDLVRFAVRWVVRLALLFGLVILLFGCGPRIPEQPAGVGVAATPAQSGSSDGAKAAAAAAYAAQSEALLRQVNTRPRFGDADPHKWERRGPDSYPVHGIDVSRWQGDIDWRAARKAGVNFAYMKATEGGDVADPKFDAHRRGAEAAGVPWGAYHYYYFCRSAESQARWFIRNVPKGAGLPHVLDMEWTPHSKTCRLRPHGSKVRSEARKFLDILESHYGQRPVIYTTVDFYQDTGIGTMRDAQFWLRSVAGHPQQVYPGAAWTFWQYTGTGLIDGIDTEVDINVFRGTPEGWLRWRGVLPDAPI